MAKTTHSFKPSNLGKKAPAWVSTSTGIIGAIVGAKMILLNIPGTSEDIRIMAGQWFDYVFNTILFIMSLLTMFLDDKSPAQQVLESEEYPYFYKYSLGNPLVYGIGGVPLSTPVYLLSLHTVDSRFQSGLDTSNYPVTLANAELTLNLANDINVTAEFFGAAPRPPHK